MGKVDLHSPLSANAAEWLLAVANPIDRSTPRPRLSRATEIVPILHAAELHGVLPTTLRALRRGEHAGRPPASGDAHQGQMAEPAIAAAARQQLLQTGLELLLRHHGEAVLEALHAAGVAAAIVKGPTFARRLYEEPAMRSFRDIDILIPLHARTMASECICALGFELQASDYRLGKDYYEDKWVLAADPRVAIEVHSDLVHNPKLRRTASVTLADVLAAGNNDPEDATAILFVASAHGAISHQFDRLQHLVDVALAANGAAGDIDVDRLYRVVRTSGVMTAVHAALVLAASAFGVPRARAIAENLRPSPLHRLASRLITPQVVLAALSAKRGRQSWRRKALRQAIRLGGARNAQHAPNRNQ